MFIDFDEFDQIIKNRLSILIAEKNISFRKLSLDLGHSNSYIQKLLSKNSNITLKALVELCNYLNIQPYDLFISKNEINIDYEDIANLLKDQKPEFLFNYYMALKYILDLKSTKD